ncbi:MAG: hypothetical protein IJ710_08600 [Prevotella sp.]|nr:hypothetical protein [Prevotella sp.]
MKKNIFRHAGLIAALMMLLPLSANAQNNAAIGILAISDTVTSNKLAAIQTELRTVDVRIRAQKAKLGREYRGVSAEVQEQLNNQEDSIYLSLLSQQKELVILQGELKQSGLQSVIGHISGVKPKPQPQQAAPAQQQPQRANSSSLRIRRNKK